MNTDWPDLIQRYATGSATAEETTMLQEALKADPELRALYLDCMNLDLALEAAAGAAQMLAHQEPIVAAVPRQRFLRQRWLWQAAAAACVAVLAGVALRSPSPENHAPPVLAEVEPSPAAAEHQLRAMRGGVASLAGTVRPEDMEPVHFEKQVLPVLENRCFKCHSSQIEKPKGGVKLDDAASIAAMFTGEDRFIVPGKPEESRLLEVMSLPSGDEDVMPPAKESSPVAKQQLQVIRAWIAQGAKLGDWKRAEQKVFARVSLPAEAAKDAAAMAREIDRLWEAALERQGMKPNSLASDEVWLRRVYLDLVGRNPTVAEARDFLASTDEAKRSALIDDLLASEGHVSHAFNRWAEILRVQSSMPNVTGRYFIRWLKEQLRANTPYDQLVRRMLTAQGRYLEDPSTGFYLRDADNKLAGVEAISEAFLGTKIDCAQCHDHPFDRWTRRDYHAFAAYTVGMIPFVPVKHSLPNINMEILWSQHRIVNDHGKLKKVEGVEVPPLELLGVSAAVNQRVSELSGKLDFDRLHYISLALAGKMISPQGSAEWSKYYWPKFPKDYQYADGKAGEKITPKPLYGEAPEIKKASELAGVFADWIAAPDNERFALVLANRLWKWMFGTALGGPPREVLPAEKAADPALMRHLEALVIATGYDLRQCLRILANTRAYQRVGAADIADETQPKLHAGPLVRRLSAEQMWDSLINLIIENPDAADHDADTAERAFINRVIQARSPDEFWQALIAELERRREVGDTFSNMTQKKRRVKQLGFDVESLTRASAIEQPAPDGHFLRIFGQSNRQMMDNSWSQATVPQALAMMNGPLLAQVTQPEAAIQRQLAAAPDPSAKVDAIFLAVLSRPPTAQERTAVSTPDLAPEDLLWTLLNTRHFLFQQ